MAKPELLLTASRVNVHGTFEFSVYSGGKHIGTLEVDNSGIVWSESGHKKGKRLLWHMLQEVSESDIGYTKKR